MEANDEQRQHHLRSKAQSQEFVSLGDEPNKPRSDVYAMKKDQSMEKDDKQGILSTEKAMAMLQQLCSRNDALYERNQML